MYEGRFQTISSIQKVTDYDEYNLYRMDVKYDYDLDRLIEYGITDNQSFVDAIVKAVSYTHLEFPAEYGEGRAIKIKFIRKIRDNYGIAV